jgi:hypothetical protein
MKIPQNFGYAFKGLPASADAQNSLVTKGICDGQGYVSASSSESGRRPKVAIGADKKV